MLKVTVPGGGGEDERLIRPWATDQQLSQLLASAHGLTVTWLPGRYQLVQWAKRSAVLSGDVAEYGVYRGGTALLLGKVLPEKTLHLYDTFQGMPPVDTVVEPHWREGDFSDTSLGQVKDLLADFTTSFHAGAYDRTLTTQSPPLCFAHVDCDLYDSVMVATCHCYPAVVPGGAIVYDDYGWLNSPGAKRAVDEFYTDKPETPVYLGTGQAVVIKL